MEYKLSDFYIGQKVRVREWDEMVSMYGLNDWGSIRTPCESFPTDWQQYCGREGVVKQIVRNEVKIDGPGLSDLNLFYTDIEPAEGMEMTGFFSEDSFMKMLGVAPT